MVLIMHNLTLQTAMHFKQNDGGAYNLDGLYLNNRWSGAGSNIVGLACGHDAIAVASGLPALDPCNRKSNVQLRTD